MSISHTYDNKLTVTLESDASATSGDGGDTMPIWFSPRSELITALARQSFTDNSSFGVPKAVVGGASNPYDRGWQNSEIKLGTNVSGKIIDTDGNPMTGKSRLTVAGEVVEERSTSGQFQLGTFPPAGVFLGVSAGNDDVSFQFSPSIKALGIKRDVGTGVDLGVIQYGRLTGRVEDYDGDPIADAPIIGPAVTAVTDETGQYEIEVPGGVETDLLALERSYVQTLTPIAGETTTQDFRYGKLTVSVLDAEYNPVSGASVIINGESYETDSAGQIEVPDVPIKEHRVIVQDYWAGTFQFSEMGQLIEAQMGPQSQEFETPDGKPAASVSTGGIEIEARDANSDRPIEKIAAVDGETGVSAESTSDGKIRILSEKTDGGALILLGSGDSRYRTRRIPTELPEDEMKQLLVELEPTTQTVNF